MWIRETLKVKPGLSSCCTRLTKQSGVTRSNWKRLRLPLRVTVEPRRSQVVASHHHVAEQPLAPVKSPGSSLAWRPIHRLLTGVLNVAGRVLMQRPTLEFVSPWVAHIKERSPPLPPSNKLINYTWRFWGLNSSWAGWTRRGEHTSSVPSSTLPTQKAFVNSAKACIVL